MDSGSENVNETVDPLFDGERMKRILALVVLELHDRSVVAVAAPSVALSPTISTASQRSVA
jgi:hypothetical protein